MGDMKKNLERIEKEICTICNKEPMSPQDVDNLKDLSEAYSKLVSAVGMADYGREMYGEGSSLSPWHTPHGRISYSDGVWQRNHVENRPYAGGYSGHSINDRMIASLEHMMSQTNDDYEREQIRNEIESIRRR